MPQPTILVGFAEALAAPEVVWSLVDEGFRVAAFARRGRASALRYSRHVVCHDICPPELDLAATLSDMSSLLTSLASEPGSQGILFPLDDKAVWLCNRLQHRGNWILAGPQGTSADLALNKYLQMEAACRARFDVPHAALARSAKDVFDFSATEPFPLILKPADCVPILHNRANSFRKWICANRAELEVAVNEWAGRVSLLVQRFVTGTGTGIFGLAAPDGIRAWSAHRRLRMMNPQGSGSSACISQTLPPDLKCKAEALIASAGWRGLFMIELLQDDSGKSWFIELNGRPWGSMALSRRQGLEYPAWHVRLAIDGRDPVGMTLPARRDVVCRHIGRELMHLLFVLRGARSKALSNWPSFWKTVREMMRLRRRDALYNWRRDDPKVFLADCYYTIHDNLFKARN